MKHLYDYFDYSSSEELMSAIEKRSPKVDALFSLFDKLTLKGKEASKVQVKRSESFLTLFEEQGNLPEPGEIMVLRFSSSNYLKAYATFEDMNDALQYLIERSSNTTGYALVFNDQEALSKIALQTDPLLDSLLNLRLLDVLNVKENNEAPYFQTLLGNQRISLTEEALFRLPNAKNKNLDLDYHLTPIEKELYRTREIQSVLTDFANNNLIDLNIFDDEDTIKDLLKISNQNLPQEHFNVVTYDENRNLTGNHLLTIGDSSSTSASPQLALPYLVDQKTAGFAIYHNHPGGTIEPSEADLKTTSQYEELSGLINKEFWGHYIVSYQEVVRVEGFGLRSKIQKTINQYNHVHKTSFLKEKPTEIKRSLNFRLDHKKEKPSLKPIKKSKSNTFLER